MWRRGVSLAFALVVGLSMPATSVPLSPTRSAHAAAVGADDLAGVIGIRDASDAALYRDLTQGHRSEPAVQQRPGPRQLARQTQPDFDRDGKVDIGVFVDTNNQFFALLSSGGIYNQILGNLGTQSIPVPGDYDGDNFTDRALYIIPQARYVYVPSSAPNVFVSMPIGAFTMQFDTYPVPGDYDGDGRWDPAIYKQGTRHFFIVKSTGGTQSAVFGGSVNDIPVPADYDFDNKTDMGVWSPGTGNWFVLLSGGGARQVTIGQEGNIPVPADYDGDARADVAVWSQFTGQWFIVRANNQVQTYTVGGGGHTPIPGDYDGDGIVDPGVYVPSNGLVFIQRASGGFIQTNVGAGRIPLSKRPSPNVFPY